MPEMYSLDSAEIPKLYILLYGREHTLALVLTITVFHDAYESLR